MKKFSTLLGAAALILGSLSADYATTDCCDSCDPRFTVGADFLWWKPNIDDLDYAVVTRFSTPGTTINADSQYHSICSDWEPGIRGWVGTSMCGVDLTLSYTYLRIDDKKSVTASDPDFINSPLLHRFLLIPESFGLFRTADTHYHTDYHNWDLLGGFLLSHRCNFEVKGLLGLTGLYLKQHWDTTYTVPEGDPIESYNGTTGIVSWNSDLWGIGLKAGAQLSYSFNRCWSLFGNAYAALLTANPETTYFATRTLQEGTPVGVQLVDDRDEFILLPGYHLQIGGRYALEFSGTEIGIRLGYEFLNWYNTPSLRRGMALEQEGIALTTEANVTTFGFHGLFLGADVSF